MERGVSFKEALGQAPAMGITEVDPCYDVEGWDVATETAVLANVLLDGDIRPTLVDRRGIGSISFADIEGAARTRKAIRLVARASCHAGRISARVAPERLNRHNPLLMFPAPRASSSFGPIP